MSMVERQETGSMEPVFAGRRGQFLVTIREAHRSLERLGDDASAVLPGDDPAAQELRDRIEDFQKELRELAGTVVIG